jgi:tight adherence protein C
MAIGWQLIIALVFTFASTVCLIFGLRAIANGRVNPIRARLDAIAAGGSAIEGGKQATVRERDYGWLRFFFIFAKLAKDTPEATGKLREQLAWAGFRQANAVEIYLGAKVFGALMIGSAVLLLDAVRPLSGNAFMVMLAFGAAFGFYAPSLWLRGRIDARRREISNPLADALDLLVSCVEAGLALEAAVERVAKELGTSAPLLGTEMIQTIREVEAGLSRSEAFRRLAARTGVTELKSLAAILVQTEMFGTSVAKSLRVLSDTIRIQRMQRAKERAATVAVRLTIPLILCLLPSLMVVLLGGAIVRVLAAFVVG